MSDDKDYYKVLGVEKNTSKEDIKKAYKKLAKQYHPDLNKEDPNAEKKFKDINEAASVLGDDQKRQQYDQYGPSAFKNGGAGFNGFDFSNMGGSFDFGDIFDQFFGGGNSFGGRRRRTDQPGSDLRHDLTITLEEAAQGVQKELNIRKRTACESCDGMGGSGVETCGTCHGQGMVRQSRRTAFGIFQTTTACPDCGGAGKKYRHVCSACDGNGVVVKTVHIKVAIPAGVATGVRLRVEGEGDAGLRGGEPGDLYVFITVEEHEYFEREENDLHLTIPVSFVQATIGTDIEVPTLFGKAKLKIPAGTQTGTIFRLRGKGMPTLRGAGTGDQMITVTVDVPRKLNTKQRKALEAFAEASGDEVQPQKTLFEKIFRK